jgi:hypothetical protein
MQKSKTPVIVALIIAAWFGLSVAFIVLKLCGVLVLSWWWLLLPLLGIPAFVTLSIGFIAVCTIFLTVTSKVNKP